MSTEVGRTPPEVRQVYERKIVEIQQAAMALTGDEASSWALLAQTVGAIVISRAMYSDEARKKLLTAVLGISESMLQETS